MPEDKRIPLEDFTDFASGSYVMNGVSGSHRWEDCMAWVDEMIARRRREALANPPAKPDWRDVYITNR